MKTIKEILLTAVLFAIALGASAQDKVISFEQLPAKARQFVSDYYSADRVSIVTEDREFLEGKSYEVTLKDGVELEFDASGNWKEVDAERQPVPASIIPASISAYIQKSFPDNEVVQISRSSREYEVELTNGIDLEFNSKGEFLRIDD